MKCKTQFLNGNVGDCSGDVFLLFIWGFSSYTEWVMWPNIENSNRHQQWRRNKCNHFFFTVSSWVRIFPCRITTENMNHFNILKVGWSAINMIYNLPQYKKKNKNSKPIIPMESLWSITHRPVESHKTLVMCCPSHAAGEGLWCNSRKPKGAMASSLACTPAAQWRLPSTACFRSLWSCCANMLLNSVALIRPYADLPSSQPADLKLCLLCAKWEG